MNDVAMYSCTLIRHLLSSSFIDESRLAQTTFDANP